jgi:hypothetical protein
MRHCAASQKAVCSIPVDKNEFFKFTYLSGGRR